MRFPKESIAPLDYIRRWQLQLWLLGVFLFLYVPLLTLVVFSFNDSRRNIVWKGFTLKYYAKALGNDSLLVAFANSLTIALIATAISVILGALSAVLLWRFRFPAKTALEGAMSLPIVVPEICMGVAMLAFFAWFGQTFFGTINWTGDWFWPFNLTAIIIAHVSFCFPFVTIVVRTRLASFNRELEEAAKDLGAGEWQMFRDILIPHMRPGLIAGALLAFTLSLDDFVITFFTSGPDTVTFPVKVYSMVRFSVTPEVNAASTLLIVLTVILTVIALRLQNRIDREAKEHA